MLDRHRRLRRGLLPAAWLSAIVLAGCGGSSNTSTPASPGGGSGVTTPAQSASATSSAGAAGGAGALSADARSVATGDIPDNQVFLSFTDAKAGWSMKYPEGWTQGGAGRNVTFSDRNNLVHVVIVAGKAPTPASVASQLQSLKVQQPTLSFTQPTAFSLPADPAAVKARYTTRSAPSPVTGKRVTLLVDRYVLHHGAKVATVDLGTPRGVDNVDAYRMMIRSFRWR